MVAIAEQPYRARARDAVRTSTDARAIRTRAALVAAAERLALTDPSRLTASNVAAAAGVSRSAFYIHFDSIPDLANEMMVEIIRDLADQVAPASHPDAWTATLRDTTRRIVEHYEKHRALLRAARSMPGSMQGHESALSVMVGVATMFLDGHPSIPPTLDPATAARWMAAGTHSVLDAWVTGAVDADAETMAENIFQMLPQWFRSDAHTA